jgi:small subunit ribosomal protein S27e
MPVKQPKSKFLKVKCDDCGSEQVVFGNPAMEVKCLVCGKTLVEPGASKPNILAKKFKVIE